MPPLTKRQFDRWAVRLKWSNLCYVELIPQCMQLFWSLTESSRDGHMLWSQKQAGNLIFIRGGPAYNLNWVADVFILLYSQFYFSRRLQKTETNLVPRVLSYPSPLETRSKPGRADFHREVWDNSYWRRTGQLLANFSLPPVAVPEVFTKVNSV